MDSRVKNTVRLIKYLLVARAALGCHLNVLITAVFRAVVVLEDVALHRRRWCHWRRVLRLVLGGGQQGYGNGKKIGKTYVSEACAGQEIIGVRSFEPLVCSFILWVHCHNKKFRIKKKNPQFSNNFWTWSGNIYCSNYWPCKHDNFGNWASTTMFDTFLTSIIIIDIEHTWHKIIIVLHIRFGLMVHILISRQAWQQCAASHIRNVLGHSCSRSEAIRQSTKQY